MDTEMCACVCVCVCMCGKCDIGTWADTVLLFVYVQILSDMSSFF